MRWSCTDDDDLLPLPPAAPWTAVYEVLVGGEHVGYAIKVVASGSQGNIEMMVGVDSDGAVTGVSIVDNSETAGIGSKVMEQRASGQRRRRSGSVYRQERRGRHPDRGHQRGRHHRRHRVHQGCHHRRQRRAGCRRRHRLREEEQLTYEFGKTV